MGVDVETGHARATQDIAERFFTPAEVRWLAEDSAPRFRLLWVLKEAYLKAVGVGITGGLDSLDCRIEPPLIVARTVKGAAPQLALAQPAGGASAVPMASVHCRCWPGPSNVRAARR